MKVIVVLLALLATSGCTKNADKSALSQSRESETTAPPSLSGRTTQHASDVLVEVDGVTLTRGQADIEVERLIAPYRNRIPPQQIASAKQKMLNDVVRGFVDRTLVLNEIKKQDIRVSQQEEEDALEEIKATLPKDLTLEGFIQERGIGKDQMKELIRGKVRFEKLLEIYLINRLVVSDEEISISRDKNKKARSEAKNRIEGVRSALLNGKDFAELAKQHSDCPSNQKGGDLGVFPRGKMTKAFEDAAFNQEVNAIGPIVETRFGYHIIQVTERHESLQGNDNQLALPERVRARHILIKAPAARTREKVISIIKAKKMPQARKDLIEILRRDADIKNFRG